MTTRTKVLVGVLFGLVCFAVGRYSNRGSGSTNTQLHTIENTTENKNTHTKTIVTETKKPDGSDTTVTVTDQVQNDTTKETQDTKSNTQTLVTPPKPSFNISVLGANDFSQGLLKPTYGISVNKEILGPVTIGAFGLMNGTIGVSIGINF